MREEDGTRVKCLVRKETGNNVFTSATIAKKKVTQSEQTNALFSRCLLRKRDNNETAAQWVVFTAAKAAKLDFRCSCFR